MDGLLQQMVSAGRGGDVTIRFGMRTVKIERRH